MTGRADLSCNGQLLTSPIGPDIFGSPLISSDFNLILSPATQSELMQPVQHGVTLDQLRDQLAWFSAKVLVDMEGVVGDAVQKAMQELNAAAKEMREVKEKVRQAVEQGFADSLIKEPKQVNRTSMKFVPPGEFGPSVRVSVTDLIKAVLGVAPCHTTLQGIHSAKMMMPDVDIDYLMPFGMRSTRRNLEEVACYSLEAVRKLRKASVHDTFRV
ncbi:g7780 [Coccomyxa elongata]